MFSPLDAADWTFPVPIRYGPGRLNELVDVCTSNGLQRPMVITDRGSRELPFIGEAVRLLSSAGLGAAVFADVDPNPTDENIAAGRIAYRRGDHDSVIAIGGGSGMDAAKSISLIANNDNDLWQYDYDAPSAPARSAFAPLVCVPTTAGTGAETESTAMVTDTVKGIKRCVWHAAHRPATVILDPELTIGLPKTLTAWTGIDALVHAIEAYTVPAWHPLCDGLALEAIRLIHRWLPTAVRDGEHLEARGGMLAGSCLAGVAFLKGLGLVHSISHMVGAVYDTHHGLTNAVVLPTVMNFNREGYRDKTAYMCRAMSLKEESFECLYDEVSRLLDELSIPKTLRDIGVDHHRVTELARKAHGDAATGTNPIPATVAQIETLIRHALENGR